MKNRVILGLDISTHCTGISIVYVNEEGELKPVVVTHLRPKIPAKIKGIEALFLKCELFMSKLEEILLENKLYTEKDGIKKCLITDIVIEEPLLSSNNTETVATLLRYNGMIAQNVYKMLNIVPQFISSYDARKYGMPSLMAVRKYDKKGNTYPVKKIKSCINKDELVLFGAYPFDCAKKMIIWNYVSEKFPEIQWVYDKKGELSKENFDASDSLICVMGYVNKNKYNGEEPKIVDFNENIVTEIDDNNKEIKKIYMLSYHVNFCGEIVYKYIEIHEDKK
jgi:hypothetical protein